MHTTRKVGALALALALGACSDAPTTAPSAAQRTLAPAPATAARKPIPAPSTTITNSPLTDALGNVVGTFTGTAGLSQVSVDGRNLMGTVLFNGSAVVNGVTTPVENVAASVLMYAGTPKHASMAAADVGIQQAIGCPVLDLALGPIHLNLLGLDVALSAVDLDIVATPGPGQLLGNLLCAVVHLLDGPVLGGALTSLVNLINSLLGGLL